MCIYNTYLYYTPIHTHTIEIKRKTEKKKEEIKQIKIRSCHIE